jgi:hypothetical protein
MEEIWNWLSGIWASLTWFKIAVGIIFLLISVVISYGAVLIVAIKIPADYFSESQIQHIDHGQPFFKKWGAVIFKNLIGFILIMAGVIMLFVPGPGILAILLGIIMMDIPGKRPFETKLIRRPAILSAINSLRAKYNKPPLILD